MTYRVELSARAARDVRDAYGYNRARGPGNPDEWLSGLRQKLESLERFPDACGYAIENDYSSAELRQAFWGPFRIVFTVRGEAVYVVTIRHGARRPLSKRIVRQEGGSEVQ